MAATRVGVDLVRDVVGVSAEAGGVVLGVGPGKTFTRGAIRADLHPLPFTIFEGLYLHTERMFFGPGADYKAAWGIGTGYAAYTNAERNVPAFVKLNLITGIADPIPMIGGSAAMVFRTPGIGRKCAGPWYERSACHVIVFSCRSNLPPSYLCLSGSRNHLGTGMG